jgi:hypothetical protein
VAPAPVAQSHRLDHSLASGRRALRTGPTSEATPEWPATRQRPALADSGPGLGQPSHTVGDGDGARLVWRTGAGRAARFGHGRVVSLGHAPTAHALGLGARPPSGVRTPSLVVYGPDRGPWPDPGVVCAAVALGGDLARGPCSPGPGDATAMERAGHRPHHPSLAGAVLVRHAVGWIRGAGARAASPAGGVVPQTPAHVCRCDRRSAAACMDLDPFLHVTDESRYGGNPAHTAGTLDRHPLLRRVIWIKSSY